MGHPSWIAGNAAYLRDLDCIETRMSSLNKPRGADKTEKDDIADEAGGSDGWKKRRPKAKTTPASRVREHVECDADSGSGVRNANFPEKQGFGLPLLGPIVKLY